VYWRSRKTFTSRTFQLGDGWKRFGGSGEYGADMIEFHVATGCMKNGFLPELRNHTRSILSCVSESWLRGIAVLTDRA
jgi:hypothetical protein